MLDQILHLLACPSCHGQLEARGENLLCSRCQKAYPVIDGIPVMLAEQAKPWPSEEP